MNYWIFLHHKCASLYLRAAIAAAGVATGRLDAIPGLNSYRRAPTPKEIDRIAHAPYCLDDNAWPELVTYLDERGTPWRAVHFTRDPRDLLVSAYWSHRNSHPLNVPGLAGQRAALKEMTVEHGLIHEMDFPITHHAIRNVTAIKEHPNIRAFDAIETAQDCARGDTAQFNRVLTWLDIPRLSDGELIDHGVLPTWDAKSGRAKGVEDNTQHYRHGVNGDWRRYFTFQVIAEFNRRYVMEPF